MAYGFESKNDDGYIQISDSVANLYMLYSGTILVPPVAGATSGGMNPGTTVTITHPTSFDAICIATEDGYVVPKPVFDQSATSVTISNMQSTVQTTLKYWLFKKYSSLSPATSGYGIEVYDSLGNVAFSSQYPKLMRSYSTIPITSLSTTPQNYSLPSNRRFAFLAYGTVYTTQVAPTKAAPDVKMFPVMRTYSGGVSTRSSNIRGGRLTSNTDVFNGGLIAIDVTNY